MKPIVISRPRRRISGLLLLGIATLCFLPAPFYAQNSPDDRPNSGEQKMASLREKIEEQLAGIPDKPSKQQANVPVQTAKILKAAMLEIAGTIDAKQKEALAPGQADAKTAEAGVKQEELKRKILQVLQKEGPNWLKANASDFPALGKVEEQLKSLERDTGDLKSQLSAGASTTYPTREDLQRLQSKLEALESDISSLEAKAAAAHSEPRLKRLVVAQGIMLAGLAVAIALLWRSVKLQQTRMGTPQSSTLDPFRQAIKRMEQELDTLHGVMEAPHPPTRWMRYFEKSVQPSVGSGAPESLAEPAPPSRDEPENEVVSPADIAFLDSLRILAQSVKDAGKPANGTDAWDVEVDAILKHLPACNKDQALRKILSLNFIDPKSPNQAVRNQNFLSHITPRSLIGEPLDVVRVDKAAFEYLQTTYSF